MVSFLSLGVACANIIPDPATVTMPAEMRDVLDKVDEYAEMFKGPLLNVTVILAIKILAIGYLIDSAEPGWRDMLSKYLRYVFGAFFIIQGHFLLTLIFVNSTVVP